MSDYSSAWTVTVAAPLAAPILASPTDGSTITDNTPTFSWGSVTGATQYQIQVDNNIDSSSPLFSVPLSISSYTRGSALANGVYYWRVRAGNYAVWSDYSEAWMVTVAVPPSAPILALPANSSTTTDATPTFDWSDMADVSYYQLHVDDNVDFSSPQIIWLTTSTYTMSPALADGAYYWRVRVKDTAGVSETGARLGQ